MATEDFTTWTETDPSSQLSATADRATFTAITAVWPEARFHYDFGANNFSGDFGPFRFTATVSAQSDSAGRVCLWGMSFNQLPNGDVGSNVYEENLRVYWNNDTLYLGQWDDANNTGSPTTVDSSVDAAVALGEVMYIEVERASGVVTAKVYTDSGYSSLADTLSITPNDTFAFQYMFVTARQGAGSGATVTGYVENLDLAPTTTAITHYYAVYTDGNGASATDANVKAGTGTGVVTSGSTTSNPASVTISGLTADTNYDLEWVATDTNGDTRATQVNFRTKLATGSVAVIVPAPVVRH